MAKLYYSISEVAKMLDVNQSLLRYWENEFKQFITPYKKKETGKRFYKEDDIESIKLIYHLVKTQGMTLSGAKKKLSESKDSLTKNHEIYERLTAIRNELSLLRSSLTLPTDVEDDSQSLVQ